MTSMTESGPVAGLFSTGSKKAQQFEPGAPLTKVLINEPVLTTGSVTAIDVG